MTGSSLWLVGASEVEGVDIRAALSEQHAAAMRCAALGEQHATATRCAASALVGPVAAFRRFKRDRLRFGPGSLTGTVMFQTLLNGSTFLPTQTGRAQGQSDLWKRDFWMNFKCIMHV